MKTSMTFGIIDVGTNSIHLLVGRLGATGMFRVLLKQQELARLGDGGLTNGRLSRQSMARALQVLRRYAGLLKRQGADRVEAVATSAVRDARNGAAFVQRVRREIGIPLRIITGREEARLIYLGVLQAGRLRQASLIVTIGGGSAQVMVGRGARVDYAVSVPLGGARLAQRFIHHDPPAPDEVDALNAYARRAWAPVARALRRHGWQRAFGSSAMIHQLMLAAYRRAHRRPPTFPDRFSVTQTVLRRLVDWLARSTSQERMALPGVDPRRQDLAFPTGAALLTWMDTCHVAALHFAPGSLREGLIMDYRIRYHQHRAGGPSRLVTTMA